MKKQIIKEFVTVKKVRYLPRDPPPEPPPPKRHVLVVGIVTLDMITVVDDHPKPGMVQRTEEGTWRRGGRASNVCDVLRRLGTECQFLGRLSSARAFESIVLSFQSMGIDISSCPFSPHQPAHQSINIVRGRGTRTTLEYSNRHHELSYQQFLGAVDYRNYSWIHFEARNAKETLKMIHAVRDYTERAGGPKIVISVDVNNLRPLNLSLANNVDYVFVRRQLRNDYAFMNGHETVWAVREKMRKYRTRWETEQIKKSPYHETNEPKIKNDDDSDENSDDDCLVKGPNEAVILYNNYLEGASCLLPDDTYFKVGKHPVQKVVDNVGENDTFTGAVIYALQVANMSLRDAMEYATRAVCLKISQDSFDGLRCMPKDLIGCYYA
ncbi:uncharacterized protein Dwil_GK17251 [Drosophila willistoni]|uniref:Carbohydrate kinase PfkB domain-containing protein n=1 Tax=Drosophila willistoni TaxID=7260 RepID=B4MKW8_DROWI|nr:ketohexokinase [Drosophila willistoni]EDW72893.2 uncharacterized protein Dwil_GK17251 [Drosophila willistoni]